VSGVQVIAVAKDDAESRLDRWFRRHFPEVKHGRLEKLLRTGQVRIDGRRAKAGDRLRPGQQIRVPPLGQLSGPAPASAAAAPRGTPPSPEDAAALQAAVLHKDADVIALNKPPGLAVQGGTGTRRHLDAMLDALRFEAAERPRLVHRLDKDTSGVLLLARHAAAARALTAAFRHKDAEKLYLALVAGVPRPAEGRIDLALAKSGGAVERMRPDPEHGKRATTYYRVLEHAGQRVALLALWPLTGRTHQLRAHCVALGTPILGDGKYGGQAAFVGGDALAPLLHLHARAIAIAAPAGGTLRVAAPLPPHMQAACNVFGFAARPDPGPGPWDSGAVATRKARSGRP
jgi:23S rRNA pseudouridine955/2504/2580 synthase